MVIWIARRTVAASIFTCLLVIWLSVSIRAQSSMDDVEEDDDEAGSSTKYDDCVNDYLKKNPNLKDRFDEGALRVACKKSTRWGSAAIKGAGKAADKPLLTPPQSQWAHRVFKCFDLKCICRMFDTCNGPLVEFEESLGNLTSGMKGEPDKLELDDRSERKRRAAVSQVEQLLAQRIGKATRKEIRRLTDEERRRFFRALQTLKTDRIGSLSKYDIMIVQHTAEYSPEAHFDAAFLPFHREFGKNLEIALRSVDPTTALHYWDPTLDQGLPDPRDSILWTEDFMGNGQGEVVNGPFANWTTVRDQTFRDLSPRRRIVRNVGLSPFGSLLRDQDIATIMTRNRFRELVYCVDPFLELTHGGNHLWVGGHMNELRISPNDPIFFLLHSFVDYIWEEWRQTKQQYTQRMRDYVGNTEACNQFSFSSARMRPYVLYNVEGLSNQYVQILFNFEQRPSCSRARPDCGSPYIFCHTGRSKCLSKIKMGGNCNGLVGLDACWRGQCIGGRCVPRMTPPSTPRPTPPPTRATRAPSPTPGPRPVTTSRDTVWFPVTVLALNGRSGNPYPKAKIVTTEQGTGTKWDGMVGNPSQRPYYTGASFAQVRSPYGQSSPVRANVNVFDENGNKCSAMCKEEGLAYSPCDGRLTLALDPKVSDGTAFSQNMTMAKYLNWRGSTRTPDRLLFLCPTGRSVSAPSPSPSSGGQQGTPNEQRPSGGIRPQALPSIAISTTDNAGNTDDNIVIRVVNTTTSGGSGTANVAGSGTGGLTDVIAAAASASLTPPKPTSQTECRNEHRCCSVWTSAGECLRNEWMLSNCRRSCMVCQGKASSGKCSDLDSQCSTWSSQGKCKSNDVWMEENCPATCNVCNRGQEDLAHLCGVPKSKDCADHNPRCKEWASNLECSKNPWWMKENCPKACNLCDKNGKL